ncbi:conserved unknown protein [Ectocarpus siliculosus]|uniref:Polymerase nucleotidyl transferase domain-containing protein n=1 Tax=Ectocarpus siliculosus TaxID=2880 RepID=D8LH60_ECTSI|nr:conserved unknown protein [Ectocarpus siliculosus]|eukprot:CBN74279.1 conserved unknown protein [Ectocarpus siliculosus]
MPPQAPGNESFQTGEATRAAEGCMTEVEPSAKSAETIPLSGSDPVEDAQEGWAAIRPPALWLDLPEESDSWADAMRNNWPLDSGDELLSDENESDVAERRRWQQWAKHAAEHERQRRMKILEGMDREEHRERLARRAWALSAMDEEQRRRGSQEFLLSIQGTNWFQGTISTLDLDYEICCPYSSLGCRHICLRTELDKHLAKDCQFNKEPESSDSIALVDAGEYEVVCPNTVLGCTHSCPRSSLAEHLEHCYFTGPDVTEEKAERAKTKEMVLEQAEEERERRVNQGDWQSNSLLHRLLEDQKSRSMVILHEEILDFAARCRDVQEKRKRVLENLWRRIEDVICLLWPDTVVVPYGSYACGMMTPESDVDIMVFPGDCKNSSPPFEAKDDQPRRRGSRTDSVGGMLTRIHELADHLTQHGTFSSMKVIPHAMVPIIKARTGALSDGDDGSGDTVSFSIDISIDCQSHTGLATSAFTSYLADHLPNLCPLTMVLKQLLQSRGLNDPFTGGLSSYGLVLMVTFALLQRDHFPPSPGSNFLQRSSSGSAPAEDQADGAQPEASRPRTLPSRCQPADVKDVPVPPSPGHASSFPPSPKAKPREAPVKKIRKRAAPSVSRQRFWQPSSFVESRWGRTLSMASGARAANALNEQEKTQASGGGRISSWDRPRQQYWLGSRTARATLMQDFYAGAPAPAPPASKLEQVRDSSIIQSSVPPPPPLPEPVVETASHPMMAPMSPYIMSGEEPVLGELLLDFLHLFGEDFDMGREGFSVRGGGFRFCVHDHPPHPQASDPIVIEDPLNCMNNVGRSSFGIGQVQRIFFEARTTLKATTVRVNQDGREVLGSDTHNTGILRHICAAMAATADDCQHDAPVAA